MKVGVGQKVKDAFDIDIGMLYDQADQNDYWSSCLDFYLEVKDCFLDEMTDKQLEWLEKIEAEL